MSSSIIYLICGSTGAGKTTYAIRLSETVGAVRFSIDEWMAALFGWTLRNRLNLVGLWNESTDATTRFWPPPCKSQNGVLLACLTWDSGSDVIGPGLQSWPERRGSPLSSIYSLPPRTAYSFQRRRPNGITPSRAPELILFVRATGKPDWRVPEAPSSIHLGFVYHP